MKNQLLNELCSIPTRSLRLTKAVHKEVLPPKIIFVDTETHKYGENDEFQVLLLGCFEVWRVNKRGLPMRNGKISQGVFRTVDEFYDLMKETGDCRIVAHGWRFDAAVLKIGAISTMTEHEYWIPPEEGIYPVGGTGYSPFLLNLYWDNDRFVDDLDKYAVIPDEKTRNFIKREIMAAKWRMGKDELKIIPGYKITETPYHRAQVICNTNFHKMRLAVIGRSFRNMEKLEMPELPEYLKDVEIPFDIEDMVLSSSAEDMKTTHKDPKVEHLLKVVKYCKRDVEILRMAWFALFNLTNDLAGITPGITVANMANRIYRKKWFDGKSMPYLPVIGSLAKVSEKAEEQGYIGGRTDVFWNGKVPGDGNLYKYDVNSMYPSVMKGPMPICFHKEVSAGRLFKCLERNLDHEALHLACVTVEIPEDGEGWLGMEGVHDGAEGRLIFPCGTFRLWTWTPMLRIAKEKGWIKEVIQVFEYVSKDIFSRYVDDLYTLRKEAKQKKDLHKTMFYKMLLNSLYGKFAQRVNGAWTDAMEIDELKWQNTHIRASKINDARWKTIPTGKSNDSRICDYWQTKSPGCDREIFKFIEGDGGFSEKSIPAIAGFITCSGRSVLLKAMQRLQSQGHRIFMCDTDSIITDGMMDKTLVGRDLGQWSLEAVSPKSRCTFYAPKDYEFKGEQKTKGVRQATPDTRDYSQAVFSNYMTALMSTRPEVRRTLEIGAKVVMRDKHVTGLNTKRRASGENCPTDPHVLVLESPS